MVVHDVGGPTVVDARHTRGPSAQASVPATCDLTDEEVDRLFQALADATRRDIIRRTLTREDSVSGLAASYAMSFAAVQKHVAVLERAGLITKISHGRERRVRANPAAIAKAQYLLSRYEELWRFRIERLDAVLDNDA